VKGLPHLDGSQKTFRVERLLKEGGWIVVGQTVTVLGSLMMVRVLTEHLGPTQYGQFTLGLTAWALISQLIMGG
jgi:O-antigen/teichoic acid export membrane protein